MLIGFEVTDIFLDSLFFTLLNHFSFARVCSCPAVQQIFKFSPFYFGFAKFSESVVIKLLQKKVGKFIARNLSQLSVQQYIWRYELVLTRLQHVQFKINLECIVQFFSR